MTFNDKIRIQYKITREIRLFFLLSRIWKNIRDHHEERNEKRNTTSHRNETDIKQKRTRKPRIRIPKETINISGRQK